MWKGTAVPTSGTVEKVYFNTELTKEEMVSILSSITYSEENNDYAVILTNDYSVGLFLMVFRDVDGVENPIYLINDIGMNPIYSSERFTHNAIGEINEGWHTDKFANPYIINGEIMNAEGFGSQNDLLSSLFSITPFVQINELLNIPEGETNMIKLLKMIIEKYNGKYTQYDNTELELLRILCGLFSISYTQYDKVKDLRNKVFPVIINKLGD